MRSMALLSVLTLVSACVYFPKAGPLRSEVSDQSKDAVGPPFTLVKVSEQTLGAVALAHAPGFASVFGDTPAREPLLGVGDSVTLVVFEAGTEPLFTNGSAAIGAASRGVSLPAHNIALDGTVSLPFAGRLQAAGLTEQQLQSAAEKALSGRASHPQIVVTASHGASGAVTVLGEQGPGVRVALTAYGERLLDVLANSGGLRGSVFETFVELRRGNKALRLPMSRILDNPAENLRLQPGDLIVVTHQPQTFTSFGATGRVAQIEFGASHVSVTEAVARAGGLQDARADPHGVYLFRYEAPEVAAHLTASAVSPIAAAPVVYQFDFARASSYFLAQRFALRDGDVLYVASAPTNELQKFLQLLGLITQPLLSGFAVDSAVK